MAVFLFGAVIAVVLLVLRWALFAVAPERYLLQADRAISQAGKIGCLVWLVGFAMLSAYIVWDINLSEHAKSYSSADSDPRR